MDGRIRRTRFEARVGIERDFLGEVNLVFGNTTPLAGMTAEAIFSWRDRASEGREEKDIETIAEILLEASTRAALVADNSRDVFEEDRRPSEDSMLELLELLRNELRNSDPGDRDKL